MKNRRVLSVRNSNECHECTSGPGPVTGREQDSACLPAYVLTVDRSGAKLKLNESLEQFEIPVKGPPGKMIGERVSMSHLSWILAQLLNRPVVDKTGLDRYHDFTLEWSANYHLDWPAADSREPPPDRNGPPIFTAREQLG